MRKINVQFIIMLYLLVMASACLLGCSSIKKDRFSLSSDADFYIVGYKGVKGYRVQDQKWEQVSDARVDIVRGQINNVVQRANLANRYLVFSEEGPPHGVIGRIISLDFQTGEIVFHKTNDYAFSSSGVSPNYYYSSEATTDETSFASFDSNTRKRSKYIFEEPMIGEIFQLMGIRFILLLQMFVAMRMEIILLISILFLSKMTVKINLRVKGYCQRMRKRLIFIQVVSQRDQMSILPFRHIG
ncbi:hypothetical protein [Streptococcus marmotae]|uniref:hypothetical protein n=1 Tax=Streptococcus marmotae TaxID=1825069 RepID=UPI00083123A1|nr:hypothetical protein [Streptococcus marmotae]